MNGGRGTLTPAQGHQGHQQPEEAGRERAWSFRGSEAPGVWPLELRISSVAVSPVCGDLSPLPRDVNTCTCAPPAHPVPSWLVSTETGEAESEHLRFPPLASSLACLFWGQLPTTEQRAAGWAAGAREDGGRGAGK